MTSQSGIMKRTTSLLLVIFGLQLGLSTLIPQHTAIAQEGQTLSKKITLSQLENSIFEETNKIRANPQSYIPILEAWKARNIPGTNNFKQEDGSILRTNEGVKAVDEAIEYLKSQEPVSQLEISVGLTMAAKDYAIDQKENVSDGHSGNDGSDPQSRMSRYGVISGLSSENISFGSGYKSNNGRDVVMGLIIDDGVPDRGHRTNIFNPDLRKTGVACGEQLQWRNICVMDYTDGQYRDNPELFK